MIKWVAVCNLKKKKKKELLKIIVKQSKSNVKILKHGISDICAVLSHSVMSDFL